jgi:Cu-Zn family superoxide dismutase
MVKKFILVGTLLITPLVLGACMAGIVPAGPERAEALLDSTAGNSVSGKVSMTQTSKRLRVVAEVSGLPPGAHAIRIHEKGDCSAPDASSAGDYFRPPGVPDRSDDLPQLVANRKGLAKLVVYIDRAALLESEMNIIGRSVVVHGFTAEPRNPQASGTRLACGVIVKK